MTWALLFLYTHHLFNTHSTEMQVYVNNWNSNNNFVLEALILFTWCIHESKDKYIREIVSCVCVRGCYVLFWMILHLNTISKVCPHLLCHCHFKHGKYSGGCIRTWSTCRLVELCKTLKLKHSSIMILYISDAPTLFKMAKSSLWGIIYLSLVTNVQLIKLARLWISKEQPSTPCLGKNFENIVKMEKKRMRMKYGINVLKNLTGGGFIVLANKRLWYTESYGRLCLGSFPQYYVYFWH